MTVRTLKTGDLEASLSSYLAQYGRGGGARRHGGGREGGALPQLRRRNAERRIGVGGGGRPRVPPLALRLAAGVGRPTGNVSGNNS